MSLPVAIIAINTNVFSLLLKGIGQIGMIPQTVAGIETDIMPVDLAAKEVLALRSSEHAVYHIMNFTPPTLQEVLAAALGDDIVIADTETFEMRFRERLLHMDRQLAAVVFGKLHEETSGTAKAPVTSAITEAHLAKVGFDVPVIALETVLKNFCKGE